MTRLQTNFNNRHHFESYKSRDHSSECCTKHLNIFQLMPLIIICLVWNLTTLFLEYASYCLCRCVVWTGRTDHIVPLVFCRIQQDRLHSGQTFDRIRGHMLLNAKGNLNCIGCKPKFILNWRSIHCSSPSLRLNIYLI